MFKALTTNESTIDDLVKHLMQGGNLEKPPLKVMVLTGAGVSTDSGLPDYRGREGIWVGTDLAELMTVTGFANHYEEFTRFCKEAIRAIEAHEPNVTHKALAELQKAGIIGTIVTQNVDGYHQAAGATDVIEVHGSMRDIYCADCGLKSSTVAYLREHGEQCIGCGGRRRPRIVLFGEPLAVGDIRHGIESIAAIDVLLVIGTSLEVAPVSFIPAMVKANGGKVAIFNGTPTQLDDVADFKVYGPFKETIAKLYQYVGKYDRKRSGLLDISQI